MNPFFGKDTRVPVALMAARRPFFLWVKADFLSGEQFRTGSDPFP